MKQTASGFLPASCRFFALLILWPWWWWFVPLKCYLALTRVHGVTFQKTDPLNKLLWYSSINNGFFQQYLMNAVTYILSPFLICTPPPKVEDRYTTCTVIPMLL
jgi:hypothetical protein